MAGNVAALWNNTVSVLRMLSSERLLTDPSWRIDFSCSGVFPFNQVFNVALENPLLKNPSDLKPLAFFDGCVA